MVSKKKKSTVVRLRRSAALGLAALLLGAAGAAAATAVPADHSSAGRVLADSGEAVWNSTGSQCWSCKASG